MFLHKPELCFPDVLDKEIECRVCRKLFLIKNGVCYEGDVIAETDPMGKPNKLAYVKVMLCSVTCVVDVALPTDLRFRWEVTKQ